MGAVPVPASPARWSRRQDVLWIPGTAADSAVAGCLVTDAFFLRVLLALIVAALVVCGVVGPRAVSYGLVVWLFLLGLVRRLSSIVGPGGPLDPLLLVGPSALVVLATSTTARSSFRDRTPLGNLVLGMSALLVLSGVNPLLGLALFPELRQERSLEAQRRRTSRALLAVLLSSTAVAAVLYVTGPWLLPLLFGGGFASSATPLQILLLGQIVNDTTAPLTARLLAAGRPGAASQASAAAAVLTVTGLITLVPSSGSTVPP